MLDQVMSTMRMVEPNKMMHEMLGTNGGKDSVCTREFLREKMVNVCQVGRDDSHHGGHAGFKLHL